MKKMMLMGEIQRQMNSQLRGFTSQEREELLTLLGWLGLRQYRKCFPEEALAWPRLQRLLERYTEEILQLDTSPVANTAKAEEVLPRQRKSRPDAMAQYPFVDPDGSVPQALQGGYLDRPNLLLMGQPGRKRFLEKVFEEMRFDRGGIRLSDLPEAFDRIGVHLSPALKRMFEKTRSKWTNGPLDHPAADEEEERYNRLHYMERYLSLTQWKTLAQRLLNLLREGRDPSSLSDLLTFLQPVHNHTQQREEFYDEEEEDGVGQGEEKDPQVFLPEYYSEQQQLPKHSRHSRSRQSRSSNGNGKARSKKEDHRHQLKTIPSKIRDLVQRDRQRFQRTDRHLQAAAKEVIAEKRVQDLMDTMPYGLYDPPTTTTTRTATSSSQPQWRRPIASRSGRDIDITEGRSALDIAEAFLHGSIARELGVSPEELDLIDDHLTPAQAQDVAAQLLGLKRANALGQQQRATHRRSSSREDLDYKPWTEREKVRQREDEAKAIYGSDWKSSRGGWVADFGPAHTHPLYRGPERYRMSFQDFKREKSRSPSPDRSRLDIPEVHDEMLFQVARDLVDHREEVRDMSNEPIADSLRVTGGMAALPQNTFATTLLPNENENSLLAEEDILSTFQKSVALKDVPLRSSE